MKESTKLFITKAEQDMKAMTILSEQGLLDNAVILAQQTVEKSLKALMEEIGLDYYPTHSIHHLSQILSKKNVCPPYYVRQNAFLLSSMYTNLRYSDMVISKEQAKVAFEIAKQAFEWCQYRINYHITVYLPKQERNKRKLARKERLSEIKTASKKTKAYLVPKAHNIEDIDMYESMATEYYQYANDKKEETFFVKYEPMHRKGTKKVYNFKDEERRSLKLLRANELGVVYKN